jgi:hypothetical protein
MHLSAEDQDTGRHSLGDKLANAVGRGTWSVTVGFDFLPLAGSSCASHKTHPEASYM